MGDWCILDSLLIERYLLETHYRLSCCLFALDARRSELVFRLQAALRPCVLCLIGISVSLPITFAPMEFKVTYASSPKDVALPAIIAAEFINCASRRHSKYARAHGTCPKPSRRSRIGCENSHTLFNLTRTMSLRSVVHPTLEECWGLCLCLCPWADTRDKNSWHREPLKLRLALELELELELGMGLGCVSLNSIEQKSICEYLMVSASLSLCALNFK